MPPSKSPRNTVKEGLKRLMRHRVDQSASFLEVFAYEPIKSVFGKRDPKDDRATALLSTAILEQSLEHALASCFSRDASEIRDQMFDGDGAVLRDLSPKIIMAYMLGIVGPATRSDLVMIRQIRNAFAHSRAVLDFETPEIAAACMEISLCDRAPQMGTQVAGDPRERFIQTSFEFSLWLFTYDTPGHENSWGRKALCS